MREKLRVETEKTMCVGMLTYDQTDSRKKKIALGFDTVSQIKTSSDICKVLYDL